MMLAPITTNRMTEDQARFLRDGLGARTVAVVGATGAVGQEALALLAEAGVAPGRVRALASSRSAGRDAPYGPGAVAVEEARVDRIAADLAGVDVVVLAVDSGRAREMALALRGRVGPVVDNSSAFRMDPAVPLVIPEINPMAITAHAGLIANPNCTTIISLVAVEPLRRAFGLARVSVTSYQAVSGAGRPAMRALIDETRSALSGEAPRATHFPDPVAFNAFPHESELDPATGSCVEELKFVRETRRLWADPPRPDAAARLDATCVRVPTLRTHLVALRVELNAPAGRAQVESALREGPGLAWSESGPTALQATGRCDVLVGRLRAIEPELGDPMGPRRDWRFFAAGDQLLKGAAWNALQLAALARPG